MTFKVEVKNLEDKIYRIIEINNNMTLADLAYTILATFDTLGYHLYNVKHGNDICDCNILNIENNKYLKDATSTKLIDLDFSNPNMIMKYDFGSSNIFTITYLDSLEKEDNMFIKEGKGKGIIDDILGEDLVKIVNDIDVKSIPELYYPPGYVREEKYDYRNYDIENDNKMLEYHYRKIKEYYEED